MAVKVLHEVCVQLVEKHVVRLIDEFNIEPATTTLALSGGFALNCPTNSWLLERFGFRDFVAPPCVNDAGISLGAALYYFYSQDPALTFSLDRVDHGVKYASTWIQELGKNIARSLDVTPFDARQCVSDIVAGPIVWFDSGGELGPRALGFRSLIGDPRNCAVKQQLNQIKQREWWRPVAPIVLEEEVNNWFIDGRPSPFMLLIARIRPSKRASVPVILHMDDTARIQTATQQQLPRLFTVLREFHAATDVPMLANTSLNGKGEPIVDTPLQALRFAAEKSIAILYINGDRVAVDLAARKSLLDSLPVERPYARMASHSSDDLFLVQHMKRHGLNLAQLQLYSRLPVLAQTFDIHDRQAAAASVRVCKELERRRQKEHGTTAHSEYLRILSELPPELFPSGVIEVR